MVAFFGLSIVMLLPRTRVAFKAPVPHVHEALGKLFIPWGMTYLIFLPCMYLQITGDERTDYVYAVTNMLTALMTFSVTSWSYMAYLQQGVRQKVLQPLILLAPAFLTVWYAATPTEGILFAFNGIFAVEWMLMVGYYIVLYRRFAHDLKVNYSSISRSMLHGLHMQWAVSFLTLVVFTLCITFDSLLWNSIDILVNIFAASVFIYTSEHMMPIPDRDDDVSTATAVSQAPATPSDENAELPFDSVGQGVNIAGALRSECEAKLLYCNPELTLADLALAIGTNRTYLSKWFVEHDTTFYNYINGLRIDYAGQLLLSTDYAVTLIQLKSGFVNKSTFRKYFMDRYGCTPSEYRKAK